MCWYTESKKTIDTLFGDGADLFTDLLAATSPRKQVRANWNLAKRIYYAHINGREVPQTGLLPSHKGNIDRALRGESLSGNKVAAFAANLKGDLNRVTIDIWVLRYFKIDKMNLTSKRYFALEKKIQRLAKRHNMKPASYQAMIWEKSIRRAGKNPQATQAYRMLIRKSLNLCWRFEVFIYHVYATDDPWSPHLLSTYSTLPKAMLLEVQTGWKKFNDDTWYSLVGNYRIDRKILK